MKRLLLFTATIALLQVPVWGAACQTGTLASYMAMATPGCTLGQVVVSGFTYKASAGGGAVKITPKEIIVTPQLVPVGTQGLQFAAPWSAKASAGAVSQTEGSLITYHVMSTDPTITVKQLRLNGDGFTGGLITTASVTETLGATAAAFTLKVYDNCKEVCSEQTQAMKTIPGVATLVVVDKVALKAQQGDTSLKDFVDWFTTCVPCVE
jgi:hypothetical protein